MSCINWKGVRAKMRDGSVEVFEGATGWRIDARDDDGHPCEAFIAIEDLVHDGDDDTTDIAVIPAAAVNLVEYYTA